MQQYRINYPLLIGLAVGTFLVSGLAYGVWKFQIERKADVLIVEAEEAYKAGDYREAVQFLGQYVKIKPDDEEIRIKYANTFADLAEQFDASFMESSAAVDVIEATLRDFPDEKELRRRVAEFYGDQRAYQQALEHLEFILEDPEAQALRATYLAQSGRTDDAKTYSCNLIGYDPTTDTFNIKEATSPNEPSVYAILAGILGDKEDRPNLAERVIDQAVEVNPDSAEAYLVRGRYLLTHDQEERGRADIEKAYRLSPQDGDVLFALAELATADKQYDKAREWLEQGKKLQPEDARFYVAISKLLMLQDDYQNALAQIDDGLKNTSGMAWRVLLMEKSELQLGGGDLEGTRVTIQDMKEAGFPPDYVDWCEARALVAEAKWFQANKLLNRLRPWAANMGADREGMVNWWLGYTYERLGKYELALRAYNAVLERFPQFERARLGKLRIERWQGHDIDLGANDPILRSVNEELEKPEPERDWSRVKEALDEVAQQLQWDDLTRQIKWATTLILAGDYAAARELAGELSQQYPDDLRIKRLLIQSIRSDPGPGQGLETALALMERMDGIDEQPDLRLDKADLLIAINDERTRPQLASLMTNLEGWTDQQKVYFWNGMADRYLRLRMPEEARHCMELIVDHATDDLATRMKLFRLALETNDQEGMQSAQEDILDVVGSENDANWLLTEARRKLWLIQRRRLDPKALSEVRRLVERALEDRPDWHELIVLQAEIETLAGNNRKALEYFERIDREQLGRLTAPSLAQYIRLLAADGQIDLAAEKMEELPEQLRQTYLGLLEIELLFRGDKVEEAIATARAQTEDDPTNGQHFYRYGQLLARSADLPGVTDEQKQAALRQAIQALEKAVELEPESGEAWYSLILYNALVGDREKAEAALRQMQLSLSADNLHIILARCYEALGRWFDAEPMYRAVYEVKPDDMERAQRLAAFYLGSGYQQPDAQEKATPLINQILRAGAEEEIPPNDSHLLWARRMGANILAQSGDYQQLLKAEKLLASNSQDGILPLVDRMEMARILSSRPEPESRIKAAQLYEEVTRLGQLNEAGALKLGTLYYSRDDWLDCQRHMRQAIKQFPNSRSLLVWYVGKLLERGSARELREAKTYINMLRELAPTDPATFELTIRLLIKTRPREEVLAQVLPRLPRITDPKTQLANEESVRMMAVLASLLTELKEFKQAEIIYRQLTEADPKHVYSLAAFVGMHGDVGRCFDLLDQQFDPGRAEDVLRVAIAVLRQRRDEIGDQFDARLEEWLDRALRENYGSVPLLLWKADFLDMTQRYDETIQIYRDLLDSPDVTGYRRAIVLNNLAYLLALSNAGAAATDLDPMNLIQEAIKIHGPSADILDTRAVILIARNRYPDAIEDMELALTENPTAAKYFHKATAQLLAGENNAALNSWDQAEKLGLSPDVLNRLEHPRYEEVKAKIEQLRAGTNSVTRTRPFG